MLFAQTTDENVACKLRKIMKQVSYDEVNGMWTFLNNGKAEMEFSVEDKKLVTYTNKMEM